MVRFSAEIKPLVDAARKNGYTIVPDGRSKHAKVVYGKPFGAKQGQRVIDENGPLIISSTPSEHRDRELTANRMLRAGVIKPDQIPWRNEKPKDQRPEGEKPKRSRLTDPDVQEAKVAAIRAKSARMKEETAKLRARLEPMIVKMGGWREHGGRGSGGVAITELADVAFHWGRSRGRVELPKRTIQGDLVTSAQLRGPLQHLKTPGSTVGEKWLPFLTLFVDELARDNDPLGKWLELLRESKGIQQEVTSPAPLPPPQPEEGQRWAKDNRPKPAVGPLAEPMLAFKAAILMARSPDNSEDSIMEVVEQIWKLENERS